MKIESITLRNLTSIEGEFTIEFTAEPLRSAGLFAITGDTGAGKSTILDAVCLALYDRAPRFDIQSQVRRDELVNTEGVNAQMLPTDRRGILRRGCKEGGCAVTFALPDGSRYEATWSVRVKRTGTYDTVQRTLTCLAPRKENVPPAEIAQRIVDVVGLDYAQFTRTVLLAQNSFANFIRASKEEKSALLEKITGTEIYARISQKIYSLATEAQHKVEGTEKEIEGVLHDRLSPEDLAELTEQQRLLTARAQSVEERTDLVAKQQAWFAADDEVVRRVAELEAAQQSANKECVAMRADELELARYDEVQPVQPLFQEIIMRRGEIAEAKSREQAIAADIDSERKRLTQAAVALDEAHERTAEAENRLTARRPAISRGHVLNGEIGEAEAQLRKTEEELRANQSSREVAAERLADKQRELDDTIAKLAERRAHATALSVHRVMFEKFDLVKDKISALTAETKRNAEAHKKLGELQRKQAEFKATADTLEKKRHDDEDALSTLRSELLIHQQSNHGHDSTVLQQRFADNRNRLTKLQRAEALWTRISTGYDEIEEKRAALTRLDASLTQLRHDVTQAERDLEVRDEAFKRLNVAYTLSQSQNIVQLRKQLKEGTACPVCGATHHPYHTETERELGELLNNLEKEYNEANDELQAARNHVAELQRHLAADNGRFEADSRNLHEREARQAADEQEWKSVSDLDASFAECSSEINREARRLMIGLLTDNTRRAADEARRELDEFNFHQGHINRLNEQISKLDAQMNESNARIEQLKTDYKIAAASAEEADRVMTLSDRTCGELYADLGDIVTVSGWFTEWKNNPDGFRLHLTSLFDDWGQTTKDLTTLERTEVSLRGELKSFESALTQARLRETQSLESRDALSEAIAGKRDELQRLFGADTPEKEEQKLQADIDKARATEQTARAAHDETDGHLKLLLGTQQSLADNRLKHQAEYSQRMSDLDLWLSRFNATHSPMQFAELEAIFTDQRDRTAIRRRLETLHQQLSLAENRLQTAREELLAHRSEPTRPSGEGEESREAIDALAVQLKLDKQEIATRLNEVSLRLLTHQRCVEKAKTYEQQLADERADAEEWGRLNDAFGSASGNKFRLMAQSYTFAYLVACANDRLRRFSPRYELQNMPGTLNLEVIDRDMFDERRYVNSLSGGETFIVSLALALGLSDLSAGNLDIGSLFIDEGFGNLDHTALDLVMTALANLETTEGRKVGIISHTDQIRERLSPQIRLVKKASDGSSRIEIG